MPITRLILLLLLLFWEIWVELPAYVRNDNSAAVYQVDTANTVTDGDRLNGSPKSNREELDRNNWLSTG